MILENNIKRQGLGSAWTLVNQKVKCAFLALVLIMGMGAQMPLHAQTEDSFVKPSWWFGAAAGANFNFHRGSTQQFNADLTAPVAFHDGFGVGLYVAPTIEYYKENSMWGMILQFGYDNRQGTFEEMTPCDCPLDMSTDLSYLTIEPSLRFAPGRSNFYLYAGPRLAFVLDQSFDYQQKANPDYAEQEDGPKIEGDFDNVNETVISMQIGAGYDIPLSNQNKRSQMVLSPFIAFHPYFGQAPRSVETWNLTTVRVGAALKFGVGKRNTPKDNNEKALAPVAAAKAQAKVDVDFKVSAPENIPAKRTVRETFPVLNYVFFDAGSTKISNRYVLLKKSEVNDFKEDQVQLYTPANLSGRSERQMVVYYNVLNILGDRMVKNPSSKVNLVGSSEKDPADGREMAESIKTYLVDVFAIDAARITTQGRDKPKIPSEKPGRTEDLVLLREGDRRVSIESNSPGLLMEFQSGPNAPLKPVQVVDIQEAPVESYVTFDNKGSDEEFTSWVLEIEDEDGTIEHFGPYTQEKIAIPGKSIMGTRPEGDYNVKMIGTTESGEKVERESGKVHMVLWTPSKSEEVMRFSITYEFNESNAIAKYDKYLREVVMPKIPRGGKVYIHGHTDDIGNADYNQKLSQARANDVKSTLQKALSDVGRTDVQFETNGFGEDTKSSPFENKHPEGRFYNRAVIIDIVPQ